MIMDYEIKGNESGETLVLLHGWPDDASLWKHQLPDLLERFRCVLVTLPNFGSTVHESGGCSIPRLMDRLERTIYEVQPSGSILLLAHDWGAILAYLYEKNNPNRVRRIVAMDVAGRWLPTIRELVLIIFYQWTLIMCWFVGGILPKVGKTLAQNFARFAGATEAHVQLIETRSIYIYFYFWRMTFFPFFSFRYALLTYEPQCPVLFLYGEQKPIRFHSQHWLKMLQQRSGKYVGFEDGDHWFMDTHFKQVNPMILDWFAAE